jgi:hypothetical protein
MAKLIEKLRARGPRDKSQLKSLRDSQKDAENDAKLADEEDGLSDIPADRQETTWNQVAKENPGKASQVVMGAISRAWDGEDPNPGPTSNQRRGDKAEAYLTELAKARDFAPFEIEELERRRLESNEIRSRRRKK